MDKENTQKPQVVLDEFKPASIAGEALSDNVYIIAAAKTPDGNARVLACDADGALQTPQGLSSAVAQMMTNQVVLLNAVDALLRRQFEPSVLAHIADCVRATINAQKPLLVK